MRLLAAELRKLRRPLTVWTVVAVVGLLGLFAWGSVKTAADQLRFADRIGHGTPTCQDLRIDPGLRCDREIARIAKEARRAGVLQRADVESSAQVLNPFGAGRMAAGMLSSLLGAVVMLLLAGGHVGHEWSCRTIKQVLAQEGRRWRVLAAKTASLWIAGLALVLVAWAALAALLLILRAAYPLHATTHVGSALAGSVGDIARAAVVLAAFAVLGVLCAVITRNTLGAFFLGFAFVLASMILAGFRSVAHLTLAYWVAGWMRFGQRISSVQTHIWRDDFYPLRFPKSSVGLIGLVVFMATCALLSWVRFERSDVKA